MRFDWYQCSVESPPLWLSEVLQKDLGGSWEPAKPRNGYDSCEVLRKDETIVCSMLTGTHHEHPHVVSTGEMAPEVSELIRGLSLKHHVSRVDACEDIEAPGWFEKAFKTCIDVGAKSRVRPNRAGDWDDRLARTLYLGSPSSAVRLRLYEKGVEVAEKYGIEAPRDWVRLEVQLRPADRDSRSIVARMAPQEVFCCTKWTNGIAEELLGVGAPVMKLSSRYRAYDLDRAEFYLCRQYGETILKLVDRYGSADAFLERVRSHVSGQFR